MYSLCVLYVLLMRTSYIPYTRLFRYSSQNTNGIRYTVRFRYLRRYLREILIEFKPSFRNIEHSVMPNSDMDSQSDKIRPS